MEVVTWMVVATFGVKILVTLSSLVCAFIVSEKADFPEIPLGMLWLGLIFLFWIKV